MGSYDAARMGQQPPPQVSPDGKFYWDGQRWVPMLTQAPSDPLPYAHEIRRQYRRSLGCNAILGLVVLGGLMVGLTHWLI